MKDELISILRDRFAGHEAPVDPGAWQAIQAKLSAGAAGGEDLQDLFQERFSGHESPVDPSAWANISSQLGHGVAVTSGSGFMGGLGWAAAGIGVLAVAGVVYLFTANPAVPEALVEVPVVVNATEEPIEQVEVAVAIPVVPPSSSEQIAGEDPGAPSVRLSRPIQASQPELNDRSTGPEPSVPASPADLLPEPGSSTIAAKPEGPAIVEGIIAQLTEEVKADVQGRKPEQQHPTDTTPADEWLTTEITPVPPTVDELPKLYLQNTFTPNGDGVNDTYVVAQEGFSRMMIRVYSVQNNQLVFSTDSNEPWTGANCIEGYYLVAVEAVAEDGRLVTQGKVVWLNRTPIH
jgi:hypothetical protein